MMSSTEQLTNGAKKPKHLEELLKKSSSLSLTELYQSEKDLLQQVILGKEINYQATDQNLNDSAHGEDWTEERTLRAELIVGLCTNSEARKFLTHRGLEISGAKISGSLNLEYASLDFPLFFRCCYFTDPILLNGAKVKLLNFSGSNIASKEITDSVSGEKVKASLMARGIQVERDVYLNKEFHADGQVHLVGATIGGILNCRNGTFNNSNGCALSANWAEIKNGVLCTKGKFNNSNSEEYALSANWAKIDGNVYLNRGFKATGGVSLVGANISGDFNCVNGQFIKPKDRKNKPARALWARSTMIKGNVFLYTDSDDNATKDKFESTGEVSLRGANISGDLICTGGLFDVLNLENASVSDFQDKSSTLKDNIKLKGFSYETITIKEKIEINNKDKEINELDWLRKRILTDNRQSFFPQPYEKLAQVLRENGHEKEAIRVLIGKQTDRLCYGKLNCLSWLKNSFLGLTIAHGYEPHRAMFFAMFFVILGSFLFSKGYSGTWFSWNYSDTSKLISPSKVRAYKSPSTQTKILSNDYPTFNPFLYSLDAFVPIVDLHQQSYWLPNAKRNEEILLICSPIELKMTGRLLLYYLWVHIALGWVLTSLWVAGFTGIVRRAN